MDSLRRHGTVRVRYIKGLSGKLGKQVPVGYTEDLLDPGAFGKAQPDPIIVPSWRELLPRVYLDDISQTVRRRPVYSHIHGIQQLIGWRWICPGCGRDAKKLYYPVGAPDWAQAHGIKLPISDADEPPRRLGCFACAHCHGVVGFTRTEESIARSWNLLVLHCSGGLLYGDEVRRPSWFTPIRKKAYGKRSRPAPRQREIERYLTETALSMKQIAHEIGIKEATVRDLAHNLYRSRGVHSRKQLRT